MGDFDRAEQLCHEAIQLDPDFGNPYNDIGTFCLRRQDLQDAIRWFEKAKQAPRYEYPGFRDGLRRFEWLSLTRGKAAAIEAFHRPLRAGDD